MKEKREIKEKNVQREKDIKKKKVYYRDLQD